MVAIPIAVLVLHCVILSSAVVVFVRPDSQKDGCKVVPHHLCDTLSKHAAAKNNHLRASNMKLVFLSGVHLLERNFTLVNLQNITLAAAERVTERDNVIIECADGNGFLFQNITNLSISNLTISSCSRRHNAGVEVKAGLFFKNVIDLSLSAVSVRKCRGYGVFLSQIYGALRIEGCLFQHNYGRFDSTRAGGNAMLTYQQCENSDEILAANVQIASTQFLHGRSYDAASGLAIVLHCPQVQITVTLTGVTMLHNEAALQNGHDTTCSKGGNLAISTESGAHISIINSVFDSGRACKGGGMFIQHSNSQAIRKPLHVMMKNCTLKNNTALNGGAVYLQLQSQDMCMRNTESNAYQVLLTSCTFAHNKLLASGLAVGVAMSVNSVGFSSTDHSRLILVLSDCHFECNHVVASPEEHTPQSVRTAALAVSLHAGQMDIRDGCTFTDNAVTGIAVFKTVLRFAGNTTIRNNSGYQGGGIALWKDSYITMTPKTTLTLSHNHANFTGGGIFLEEDSYNQVSEPCFYRIDAPPVDDVLKDMKIELLNNSAEYGGSQIYGGRVDSCLAQHTSYFSELFKLQSWDNEDLSVISSDANRVLHFCQEGVPVPNTAILRRAYSGEHFNVSVALMGQRDGTEVQFTSHPENGVVVKSKLVSSNSSEECSNYSVAVYTQDNSVILDVAAKSCQLIGASNHAKQIHLDIPPPPLGFVSTGIPNHPYECIKSPNISAHHFSCELCHHRGVIMRPPPYWLGYMSVDGTETTPQFVLYSYCPTDYCKRHYTRIHTDNETFRQDDQCAYKHAGTLCGQCRPGLSLSLGSSLCFNCSGTPFIKTLGISLGMATLGVLLVFLLLTLNITVTRGTLSGSLFYTTVFYYYWATLLPNLKLHTISRLKAFFKFFIFASNLLLSCNCCLYDGLGVIGRTWVQFILVVYLWALAGAIIWVSRRYSWVNRHIGSNAVPTLATIILYSHTSTNLAIVHALTSADLYLSGPGNTTVVRRVLLYDGNIPYFHKTHIPLFIVGCIFAMLSLCFTLTLLCVQPLQRYSHLKPFRWVNKLKPLLDAYTCPHIIKPHCRFWNGFLLLVRTILYIILSSHMGHNYHASLSALSIACFVVITTSLVFGGVYTKQYLNILFSSYIVNLGVLAVVARDLVPAFHHPTTKNSGIVVASLISLGVATVTSLSVVGYHTYQKVRSLSIPGKVKRLCSLCKKRGSALLGRDTVPNYQALGPCVGDSNEDDIYIAASTSSDLEIPRNLHPPLSTTYREPQLMDYDST